MNVVRVTSSINSRTDLTASLDDGHKGVLAEPDAANQASLGVALGRIAGVLQTEGLDDASETAVSQTLDAIGEVDHLVFLLLDGFGMNFVDTLPVGSFAREHVALEMCSLFPTSTAPNLISLATGRWPGEHGSLGWDTHIPRLGERIQPLTWRRTRDGMPLTEVGFAPEEMLLAPVIPFGASTAFTHVVDERIAGSMTTRMLAQSEAEAFSMEGDAVSEIVEIAQRAVSRSDVSSFTYIYWSEVDSCAHSYGVSHPITRASVTRANALLEALANGLSGKAKLVATADHGHLDSPEETWSTLTPSDPISALLKTVPAGEPRVLFFHTKPGEQDAFQDLFTRRFGDRFALLTGSQAIDMGILGAPRSINDACRARVGDFVAISRGAWSMSVPDTESRMTLASMHGGITTAESIVPLIVA